MRKLMVVLGLFSLAYGQVAISADAADKPIVLAAVKAKHVAPVVQPAPAHAAVSRVTRENVVPEGSLEKFGSVGLPQ
jgi:hypothetical protein